MSDIIELQKRISNEPDNYKLLCLLSNLYKDEGMYSKAIEILTKAIAINDRDSTAFCDLGKCYFKIKEIEKGMQSFLKAVELDNENIYALQNLAKNYIFEKNYDLAQPICKKLLIFNKLPDFMLSDFLKLARINKDIQVLNILFDKKIYNQVNDVNEVRHYISFLMDENLYNEAEKVIIDYTATIKLDENTKINFIKKLASIYIAKNEYEKAKNIIIEFINNNSHSKTVLELLSNYAIATNDIDFSVSYINQVVLQNPYNIYAWEQLMNIYHACGNDEKEKEAQQRVESNCEYHIEKKSKNKQYIRIYIRCLEKKGLYEIAELYKKQVSEFKNDGLLISVADEIVEGEESQTIIYENNDNEPVPAKAHFEGLKKQVIVNKYERNNYARKMCIAYHKPKCSICGFDFEKIFGIKFKGKIHVHHIKALYEIDDEYDVDPINDLIPVCPNCHFILHSKRPPYKPYEVIKILTEKQSE